MKQATLAIPIRGSQLILGMKKRGFGVGKLNGFGGKVQPGETVEQAAARELKEEAGITAKRMEKVAEISFYFPYVADKELRENKWNQVVHIYFVHEWEGEPLESEEMSVEFIDRNAIPFHRMWDDDKHWLPHALEGRKLKGDIVFGMDNGSVQEKDLKEVDGF